MSRRKKRSIHSGNRKKELDMSETETARSEVIDPKSLRDRLRSNILSGSARKGKRKLIKFFDQDVEIRQPTVRQIQELADEAKKENSQVLITTLIEYCYVPGTNDKLFEEQDRETLLDTPAGDWLTELNRAVEELTGIKVEESEKNLDKTA